MSEEKNGFALNRYSFRRSLGTEKVDIPKNQFGQVVIGEKKQSDDVDLNIIVDPEHGLQAGVGSILDLAPQVLYNLMNSMSEDDPQRKILLEQIESLNSNDQDIKEEISVVDDKDDKSIMIEHNEYIRKIMDLEDEEEPVIEKISTRTRQTKKISDASLCIRCGSAIPLNAKFCSECGTSQIVKFCNQCGFRFVDLEKFCPECGMHR